MEEVVMRVKKQKELIAMYGALKMVRKLIEELNKQEASINGKD